MKNKQYSTAAPELVRIVTLIALTIAFLLSGCEVLKTRNHLIADTVSVKKSVNAIEQATETVQVKTEDKRSTEENEWFKLTLQYLAAQKSADTTIYHLIPQPATIIYEGGRSNRSEEIQTIDSTAYNDLLKRISFSADSMSRRVDQYEKTKHSETKGIGWLILILVGVGLVGRKRS